MKIKRNDDGSFDLNMSEEELRMISYAISVTDDEGLCSKELGDMNYDIIDVMIYGSSSNTPS